MAFDDFVLGKIDRDRRNKQAADQLDPRRAQTESIGKAHKRAHEVLNNRAFAIQATEFVDLYGKDNVLADMRRVKAKQQEITATDTERTVETRQAAEVFEAIVLDQVMKNRWLGRSANVFKTSIFDDYFNAADLIAEWTNERKDTRVLSLSVDVTFGLRSVEKKLGDIRRRIDKGDMGVIKYFKSADGTLRGERSMVPQVVVGLDRRMVAELAQLWLQDDTQRLASHPAQAALVSEIRAQLNDGEAYAKVRGQKEVADSYSRSGFVIEDLMNEKIADAIQCPSDDRVCTEILSQSAALFRV